MCYSRALTDGTGNNVAVTLVDLSGWDIWVPTLSALLGGLLTGGTLLLNERWRWKRERSARWDDVKRATYVEFSSALTEMHRKTLLAVHPGNPQPDVEWREARLAWYAACRHSDEIGLLAPQTVQDAALALLIAHQSVSDMLGVEHGLDSARETYAQLTVFSPHVDSDAAARRIFDMPSSAQAAFIDAARADINPT